MFYQKKRPIIPEQEFIRKPTMMTNTTDIGKQIQLRRKSLGITQRDLALTSGTGIRFIVELEQGKATCQIGKVLAVLQTLGLRINLSER